MATRKRRQACFEVYQDAAGQYRWRLVAPNGRIIADSGEGYVRKSGAEAAAKRTAAYLHEMVLMRVDGHLVGVIVGAGGLL